MAVAWLSSLEDGAVWDRSKDFTISNIFHDAQGVSSTVLSIRLVHTHVKTRKIGHVGQLVVGPEHT
jgi:hypothetical protein